MLLFSEVAGAGGSGLLVARGSVYLNGFRVWGNGTVTENMTVETDRVGARITLNSGAEVLLAPSTRVRLAHDGITLESGSAMIRRPGTLAVKASKLARDRNGDLLAGPRAAEIPLLLEKLKEERPLSQRP